MGEGERRKGEKLGKEDGRRGKERNENGRK